MKRIFPLLLVLLSSAAWAESGVYRVEVIVFRNLAVSAENAEAVAIGALRSFSSFPALEKPVLPLPQPLVGVDEPAETIDEPTEAVGASEEADVESAEPPRFDLPDDLRVVSDKSPAIDDAWRRLRGSADYRPLLYAAWEQNRVDYYPPMRIHDQQLIDTQLRPPTRYLVADLAAPDPLAVYRSAFYQLDGSVQLRRSRFLHLYLDLEYRQAQPETTEPGALPRAPEEYRVFKIRQNRQIRTGRLQYFDTPQFGVLVLVTATQSG